MKISRAARFCLVLVLTSTALLAVQQDEPGRLRVDVRLVNVYATVTDSTGRYVSGLKKNDFTVFEDGKRVTLAHFAKDQDTPISVGIVLDTSGSMRAKLETATEAVDRFVRTIHPDDDIFLMSFAGQTDLLQDFTSDRTKLQKALNYAESQGGTALYDALAEALDKVRDGANNKRAILLITDGEDTNSRLYFEDVREKVQASESLLYALGISVTRETNDPFAVRRVAGRDVVEMDVLDTLARDSGGAAYTVSEDMMGGRNSKFAQILAEIAEELRNQYTLAYYPTHPDDGQLHSIRVTTRNGYDVRARHGYVASPER